VSGTSGISGTSRYGWNAGAARYYDRLTGRYASRDTVRLAIDDVVADAEREVREVTEAYRRGELTLDDWQAQLRDMIKETFLDAEATARGGWQNLTQADFGRVGQAVREQYRYLDRFTTDIRNGLPLDGRFLNRAAMYAKAARPFFHDEQRELLEATGYTEERNVLHAAEHCETCVVQSALDWVLIGTLIPIGERTCLGNDRCSMRYR
jgi:hypothetical protein